MGPGPINAHPRVLRAMSAGLLGQYDPEFTAYMNETMALYRHVFKTTNRWTFLIDGSARAAIEAALVSLIEPGDPVVVVNFGRFGLLLREIAERCGAAVTMVDAEWGTVVEADAVRDAVRRVRPRVVATVHGDTSTTMAQPIHEIGRICVEHDALLYVDATATLSGMEVPVDAWRADIVTAGLQKCLAGPPGTAPITISERAAERIFSRRHVERGIAQGPGSPAGATGRRIASNYFDLAMLMEYWSERRLNHHTEATTMLYGARECARLVLEEGLEARIARHALVGRAMVAGLQAMGLRLFGDRAHKMANVVGVMIPDGIDGERVRTRMRTGFEIEIGTAFGPLAGRIWRIGTMGYNCRGHAALITLGALEAVLRSEGAEVRPGEAVQAAMQLLEAPAAR
ncbi:alanine--glyoxylate aminotransferase family protein [Lichenicoccus roseus]|uniref:Alanine--glyoxylate aminotransferase family protein n=2 Tax=Lichenicoccus roseus TaxID=2683649 RepID=A0A5R9JBH3_9PROT|nr:alanine--glyoxylate aminotransferase family protein [Lichenicoccus roseus]